MSRRLLAALALLLLLAGAGVLALRDGERGEPLAESAEEGTAGDGGEGPLARRPALRSPRAQPGAISGRVVDPRGRGVPGASVTVQGRAGGALRSGEGGAFRVADLAPGEYVLFASADGAASEPVGPVPLGAGEELRDLALVLEAGAALSGTVRDARDGKAIAGAAVTAGAASATSDEEGRYRLTGLPGGVLGFYAYAEGYVPRTTEVELVRGRERTGADVHLGRAARVRGRVTAQGQPVYGAEILAARYGFASRLSALEAVAVTDSEGNFAGDVAPGRMQLVARAAGWAEARTDEFELEPSAEREANLTLGPGGSVAGRILDAQGAAVSGCPVAAYDAVHGRVTTGASSGPVGEFLLVSVPPAMYLVVATCEAGRAEVGGVAVTEGGQAQVELRLGEGTIGGRVVDGSGQPVAGAVVSVRPDGSAAPESAAAQSGPDGAFLLRGLAGGRFAVSAASPQGRAERAGVASGTRDLVLALGAGSELLGVVVGDRGEPISDYVVYAEPAGLGAGRPRSQRFLSPTGEFRMPLPPGSYALRVGAPGYGPGAVSSVEVRAGGASGRVKVTLVRGATVRGRAVDPGGRPISGAQVGTHRNVLYAYGRAAPVPAGAFATTDAQGAFTLHGVPTGERVFLFAAKEGWVQRGPAVVSVSSGGEVGGVEVRLTPGGRGDEGEREFAGVGMTLGGRGEAIVVIEVFEGGPAREAGLRPGDQIVSVDGAPARGAQLADVIGRIRGVVGTTVTLVIRRDGRDATLAIPRAVVKF